MFILKRMLMDPALSAGSSIMPCLASTRAATSIKFFRNSLSMGAPDPLPTFPLVFSGRATELPVKASGKAVGGNIFGIPAGERDAWKQANDTTLDPGSATGKRHHPEGDRCKDGGLGDERRQGGPRGSHHWPHHGGGGPGHRQTENRKPKYSQATISVRSCGAPPRPLAMNYL